MLQATQMTQEVTIKDLESEKSRANERLSQLEEERAFLQSKTQSLDEEQKQQVLELEKVKSKGGYLHPTPSPPPKKGRKSSVFLLFRFDLECLLLLHSNSLLLNSSNNVLFLF